MLDLRKSLGAGLLIGLCYRVYSTCPVKVVGAFLFGIGLATICACKLDLFTGKVGASNDIWFLSGTLLVNAIGVIMMRALFISDNPVALGIGCGMLMQIGVIMFRKGLSYVTVMCVAAFLLSGFSHSVAMVYNVPNPLTWLLVVVGNAIGAKLIYHLGVKD